MSSSTERFRKYCLIGRDRFDDIYRRAALSGEFHLHPLEPRYAELHPGRPIRPGRAQLDKVPPLCLKMTASFRRLTTGQSFVSLSYEFRIGLSTLHKFDKQFLKWFRLTYWKEYVVAESGVGFDDYASIEKEETVFRQFGLPGFVTCMDGVHLAWELAPFMSRWQYKGKDVEQRVGEGLSFRRASSFFFVLALLLAKSVPAASTMSESFLHVLRIFEEVHFPRSPDDGGPEFAQDVELMRVEFFEVRSLDATFALNVFITASRFVAVLVQELLVQGAKLLDALLHLPARGNFAVDQNLLVQNREQPVANFTHHVLKAE